MRRYIVSFTGMVLLIFVTQGVVASPAQGDGCRACHIGEPHTKGLMRAGDDCKACHGNPFTAIALTERAAAPVRPSVASRATATLLPGMSLPMYYAESRIGDGPNEMVLIPAGEFIRGTNVRLPDEGPQHVINLPAFYIDKYEVTNLQYKKYIDEVGRRAPDHFVEGSYPPGKVDHPVTYVSWSDAKRYCEWAGKRLPSDVEWEKAARGTDGRTFPWGNEFIMEGGNTPVRWETLQLEGDTTPVGAFEKGVSPYGLYDVSGNVWEWTDSWYMAYPGNQRITENYGQKYRTLKGGSWWDC
ncbi:MAG: serine/threonine protein kinase, partial [Halothiobacillaceae bacterium]